LITCLVTKNSRRSACCEWMRQDYGVPHMIILDATTVPEPRRWARVGGASSDVAGT
jgi:hypothetical protein